MPSANLDMDIAMTNADAVSAGPHYFTLKRSDAQTRDMIPMRAENMPPKWSENPRGRLSRLSTCYYQLLVTTSKALVTSSDARVTRGFLDLA